MSLDILQIDVLLYIALSEEFNHLSDELIKELGGGFVPQELVDIAITIFCGKVFSPVLNRDFQIAAVPAGKMGNTRAAAVTSAILAKSQACDVVVLGIAGSLSNDLQPGDVFIPDSTNEYLANSATKGTGKTWTFETSGNHLPTSPRLLNRFQVFPRTQRTFYEKWLKECAARFAPLIEGKIQEAMTNAGLDIRPEIRLFAGDDRKLASGPAVGKGKAFVEWIKREVDRKVAAMEMESAGVYDAVQIRTPAPRVIAIRGISDFADERKALIEDTAKDRFRAVSAKNALSLLLRGIEAGLFKEDVPRSSHGTGPEGEGTNGYTGPVIIHTGDIVGGDKKHISKKEHSGSMKLTGQQYKQLQQAMLDALPTEANLQQMVTFELGENLAVVAGGGNLSEITFNLIRWAQAQGRLEELIQSAIRHNPGNQALQNVTKTLHLSAPSSKPAPPSETPPNSKDVKVFICYAREDNEIATKLYADLERIGVSPWLDTEDLKPGHKWQVVIPQMLKTSSYVLILLSSYSITKQGFVQVEIKEALEFSRRFPASDIFIIPIRLEECSVPAELQELQWVDFFPEYDAGFRKLLQVLAPEGRATLLRQKIQLLTEELTQLEQEKGQETEANVRAQLETEITTVQAQRQRAETQLNELHTPQKQPEKSITWRKAQDGEIISLRSESLTVSEKEIKKVEERISFIVFYSWQSDLPSATNRNFIQKALENVTKTIHKDESIVVDRDTVNIPGSPDITNTIFKKLSSLKYLYAISLSLIREPAKDQLLIPMSSLN